MFLLRLAQTIWNFVTDCLSFDFFLGCVCLLKIQKVIANQLMYLNTFLEVFGVYCGYFIRNINYAFFLQGWLLFCYKRSFLA